MKRIVSKLIPAVAVGWMISSPVVAQQLAGLDGLVTDREQRVVKKIPKPAPLGSYQDPAFGTKVTRISAARPGGVVKTMYNTIQAWNADESRLILYHAGKEESGHHLYGGKTYQRLRKLDFTPADIEEVFWDPKSAAHLYYVQRYPVSDEFFGKLVKYNVFTDEKVVVTDLAQVCGHAANVSTSATSGSDVQGIYGDHIGVRCNNNAINGNSTDSTFYVNVRTGAASSQLTIDPRVSIGSNAFGYAYNIALAPAPSNQYVLLQDSVFDAGMNFVHHLDTALTSMRADDGNSYSIPKPEHKTIGSLPNGRDAMYTAAYNVAPNGCNGDANQGVGSMVAYDLESAACRVVVGQSTGWGYPQSGTHVSAISKANPGWVTMSTIGYGNFDYFDNGQQAPLLFSELSLTHATESNPVTYRLAHTRTYAKYAQNDSGYDGKGYFGEPHPVISPSGTRVLFSSDWYDSGSVDTYVVVLPEGSAVEPPEPVDPEPPVNPDPPVDPDPITDGGALSTSKPAYQRGERVLVTFAGVPVSGSHRVTIAPVGTPAQQLKMWLYTNGTQKPSVQGPASGELSYRSEYIGIGEFEARLMLNESRDDVHTRVRFTVSE